MTPPALRVLESHARTYKHTWKGSAFSTFLSPVLFLLAMGMGLGALIDRGEAGAALPGGSYLAFIAPALLAATAMQNAAGDSSWPVMAGLKWLRTYHAALATPITPAQLVYGQILWVALRLLLSGGVFVGVMILFDAIAPLGGVLALGPAVLVGLAFSGAVTTYAATIKTEYGLSSLFRFGIVPLFLFSGTFFPIEQLPAVLRPLAYLTPLWHGVELCRAAALDVAAAWPWWSHVAYLLAWALAGLLAAVHAFTRRLRT
jgi:lipooligosaccharide transport system permease protein